MQSDLKSNKKLLQECNLYIIISVTLIAIMGGQTIAPILPDLTEVFDVSPRKIELVMTVFFLPIGIATPILGILADRVGIRKVLVPSLVLFAVAGGFISLAQEFQTILGWRFLQGLGAASLDSLALTMISMVYHGKALTMAMSLNASVIGVSTAIYPLIGGVLGGLSWRYPFLLSLFAFPLVMLIFMVLKLPQRPRGSQKSDLKVYLKNTWDSINNRSVLALLLAIGALFTIQFGAFITFMPILAGDKFGASGLLIGLILASMSVSLGLVASQLGWLVRRISEITLINIAFIIIAIALSITPTIHNAWLLIVPSILFGIAQALALPSSQALLAGLATDHARAGFMAANASVQSLGQAVGPLVGGISFGLWGMQGVFWATAGIALATVALFNFLLAPKQEITPPFAPPATTAAPVGLDSTTAVRNLTPLPTQTSYRLSTSISYQLSMLAQTPPASPSMPHPVDDKYSDEDYSYSPTIAQLKSIWLIHLPSDKIVELPNNLPVIRLGKPNDSILPDVDLSSFPNSEVISRRHADIRIEGDRYYIKDRGSANSTYLNRHLLLPGSWHELRLGDRINFGKGNLVTFIFQISSPNSLFKEFWQDG